MKATIDQQTASSHGSPIQVSQHRELSILYRHHFEGTAICGAEFALNNPIEGSYLYHGEQSKDKDVEQILDGKKDKVRIIFLSRNPNNELMCAHYANGQRGVAVGVEVDRNCFDVRPILYDGIPALGTGGCSIMAEDILSHKNEI